MEHLLDWREHLRVNNKVWKVAVSTAGKPLWYTSRKGVLGTMKGVGSRASYSLEPGSKLQLERLNDLGKVMVVTL
jgi:hypothetical protein